MKLLWLDLETTGLDPIKDRILEIAVCVADLERPFDTFDHDSAVLRLPDVQHAVGDIGSERWCRNFGVPDAVREMHTRNGIWAEVARSDIRLSRVEEQLLSMIDVDAPRDDRTALAGRNVGFDLGFLRAHMPMVAQHLSHRVYDVSAIALFCESLGMQRLPKGEAHRAMADVRESIEHARRCAEWLKEI